MTDGWLMDAFDETDFVDCPCGGEAECEECSGTGCVLMTPPKILQNPSYEETHHMSRAAAAHATMIELMTLALRALEEGRPPDRALSPVVAELDRRDVEMLVTVCVGTLLASAEMSAQQMGISTARFIQTLAVAREETISNLEL